MSFCPPVEVRLQLIEEFLKLQSEPILPVRLCDVSSVIRLFTGSDLKHISALIDAEDYQFQKF